MEEKQEKKQPGFKGKIGIVWLTGILVIILGCVTVYTFKLVNENKQLKEEQPVITETKEQIQESTSKTEEQLKNTNNTTVAKDEKITSMTSEEKFSSYISNMKKEMKNKIVGTLEGETYALSINEDVSFEENETNGSTTGIQNHKISLSSDGKLKVDNKIIAENVFNFKVLQIGSNGLHYIVFVNEKGTAGYMRVSKLKTMANDSVHEIKNVKNIISILGTIDMYNVGLTDIEGNIIKVNI